MENFSFCAACAERNVFLGNIQIKYLKKISPGEYIFQKNGMLLNKCCLLTFLGSFSCCVLTNQSIDTRKTFQLYFFTAIEAWNIVKTVERCEDLEKDIDNALEDVKSAKATAIELKDDVSEVEANITIVSSK